MPTSNGTYVPTRTKLNDQTDPATGAHRPLNTGRSTLAQVSIFIAGSLAAEGLLDVELGDQSSMEKFTWASDLIASILEPLIVEKTDLFILPFERLR